MENDGKKPSKRKYPLLSVQAKSAGKLNGDMAEILVNGEKVYIGKNESGNFRGLHVVIINVSDGKVEFAKAFDTHKSSVEFE